MNDRQIGITLSAFFKTVMAIVLMSLFTNCNKEANFHEAPDEHRFRKVVLTEETMDPTALAVTKDGKVYFTEDFGIVKVYLPESNSIAIIGELDVFECGEEGLIGMALDPDFEQNGWMYINRTVSEYMNLPCSEIYSDPKKLRGDSSSHQAISRFMIKDDVLDVSSEKVLLKIPNQHMRHMGGSMAFDANGNLYISIGENTHPGYINPYAPLDERPGRSRYDTQRTSSNSMDYRGKILRIHPEDDGTYTIPDGNLFPKDDPKALPEIYVMGCRNPFRISVDHETGTLFWGEVGPDAYADIDRGPKGYDEINKTNKAGFFGWPYFIADNQPYAKYDYDTEKAGAHYNPEKPENNSPNNTGKKVLPAATPAFIWYPYVASKKFPELGEGGRTAMAGPVYHYDESLKSDIKFPAYFDKALFIYDWMRGWIKVVRMDENGNLEKIESFMPSTRFVSPVDMTFGPDGALYVIEFGTTWGNNPDARLIKLEYIPGNRPPHVEISADQTIGACPMKVNFSSAGTMDYDEGDKLSYAWSFDGESVQSTSKDPSFTFEKPGTYQVQLIVTDENGAATIQNMEIKAGNDKPKLSIEIPHRGSFYWKNETIPYVVHLSDKEDGSLANGDIDPSKVQVTLEALDGTYAFEMTESGTQELKSRGEKLIGESDCKGCHRVNEKVVGPSYIDVSNKYKGDESASTYLAKKIISGGSGVWGEVIMNAHPLFSEADAERMADYILSLGNKSGNVKNMGIEGTIKIPDQEAKTYVLKATYTDHGSSGMEPITVSALRVLQPPKLEAENFSTQHDVLSEVGNTSVAMGFSSTYITFKNIDLTSVDSVTFRYNYGGPECSIEIRTGSPKGESLGKAYFHGDSKARRGSRELTIPIKPTSGSKELFFLHDKAPDIHVEIGLDWIYFHRKGEAIN